MRMAGQSIMLHLPDDLYRRLARQARLSQHSVEEEVLQVVATSISPETVLPASMEHELEQLDVLNDEELWQTARNHLSTRDAADGGAP